MKLNRKITNIFNKIKTMNGNSPDLNTRVINVGKKKIGYIFLESVSNGNTISETIVKSIIRTINNSNIFDNLFKNLYKEIKNTLCTSKIKTIYNYEDFYYFLVSGYTCIIIDGVNKAIAIETKENLDRSITEPTSEMTIKGPKDAFNENYNNNIGLIRKRIKDPNLWIKEQIVGRRSKSKVGVIYINDIANMDNVNSIINKINKIDIDGVMDIGYIRDFLIRDSKSFFPVSINTERPDIVCSSLLEGKIAIILENSPNVLVIPGLLNDFIHAPEDNYQKAINITLTRFLRFLALIITIATPALYIAATTFNQEVIPDTLLISLALQRAKIPFPNAFSIFILMITFEILRESDIRLPSSMGTSISIVGALVLGDAAVNAGLVSPMAVIVVAITAITGLLFSDTDIVNACRWWRFIFLIFSTTMGFIGFVVAGIILITKLASIESFGIPYLMPYSPLKNEFLTDSIMTKPHNKLFYRPSYFTNNRKRLKK